MDFDVSKFSTGTTSKKSPAAKKKISVGCRKSVPVSKLLMKPKTSAAKKKDPSKSDDVMKALAELKSLMKSVIDKPPPEARIILPVQTVLLPPPSSEQTVANQKPVSPANQKL